MRKTVWIFLIVILLGAGILALAQRSVGTVSLWALWRPVAVVKERKAVSDGSNDNLPILIAMNKKFHSRDVESAIRIADGYLAEFPKDVKVLSMRGWALSKMGRKDEANASFDAALSFDPTYSNAYVGKASLARSRGDFQNASDLYAKALKLDPKDAFVLSSYCALEISKKEFDKAVELCESAYDANSEVGFIAANLAVAYHRAKRFEKRDALYHRAVELQYENAAEMEVLFYGTGAAQMTRESQKGRLLTQ